MKKARAITIKFGVEEVYKSSGFLGLSSKRTGKSQQTGSVWDYWYPPKTGLSKYSGRTDVILGPGCKFNRSNYACFATPTDEEKVEKFYNRVTLKKSGRSSFLYLDVGFWGANRRTFGLVCGRAVWLCEYGTKGERPNYLFADSDSLPYVKRLEAFYEAMANFTVLKFAIVHLHGKDWQRVSKTIYIILPDMHMWPDPKKLAARKLEFFTSEERRKLDQAIKKGEIIRKRDGTLDIPDKAGETPADHAVRLLGVPAGTTAMKDNALNNPAKMAKEEEAHAFGSKAGQDLVRFLRAAKHVRTNLAIIAKDFDVDVVHVGDLLEMWAPWHTAIDGDPFEKRLPLELTNQAKIRVPKWLNLTYNYDHNKAALDELDAMNFFPVYGNHDVYLAAAWKSSGVSALDRLMNTSATFFKEILWVEHGHRFQPSNRDGYWLWSQGWITKPPGPIVNSAVNYYPDLRILGERFDNSVDNRYKMIIPYASMWYLLSQRAVVPQLSGFNKPPPFRIFCQGHTHEPELLKVQVSYSKSTGKGADYDPVYVTTGGP